MSTLSLDDLGPKMRLALGLEESCHWADLKTGCVAAIPVIETTGPAARKPEPDDIPGAAWLTNENVNQPTFSLPLGVRGKASARQV